MRLVCVTGMHRSGTSLVARMLNLLGVDLGDDDDLLGAAPDNPTGFWEHREVKQFNDRIFAKLGGRWDDPPHLPPGWEKLPELNPARKDAAAFVADLSGELMGWKDPRLSLTLPFWRTVTAIDRTVLCLRDPEEVAGSLAVRNGLPAEQTADLWVRYTLSAWANDPEHLVVRYSDALRDPEGTSQRLVQHLGLPEPDPATLRAVGDFVEPNMRHHEQRSLDGPGMRVARSLYAVLGDGGEDGLAPLLGALNRGWHSTAQLDGLSERLGELLDERDQLEEKRQALQEAVARRDAQLDRERERRNAQLDRERERWRIQDEMLRARIMRLETDVNDLRTDLERSEEERQRSQSRVEEAERDIVKLREANEDLAELRNSNRDFKLRLKELEREHRQAERRYDRLRNRRIVRIGLAVAQLFQPLFRFVRRMRSRSTGSTDRSPPSEREDDRSSGETGGARPINGHDGLVRAQVDDATLERLRELDRVTVIVPVHNALSHVERCMQALIRNTSRPAGLLVIDDASTDPEVAPYLDELSSHPHVDVLRNATNEGFTATVNRGFAESQGDVVVLNSDTEVTPRWLENLTLAAYRDPDIGTVTAVSNNAGAFSVPDIGVSNATPPGLTKDQVGRLVTQRSERIAPESPTGNGFCMYIKRAVIEDVGILDAEAFPRGYGEENDFCLRALDFGYRHVVDDATFVFHVREASFGSEKQELAERGRKVIDRRYPDYTVRVRTFVRSPELRAVQQRIRQTFDDPPDNVRRRVLYVIHAGTGGAPQTNQDLVSEIDDRYECFVLTSDTKRLVLLRYNAGTFEEVRRHELDDPIGLGQFSRDDYRSFVTSVLVDYAIELVHVRHLIKHTFDAPAIAADLSIPVVLSFHDFYLSCPTVHLLDDEDRFCGGRCTPGQGRCRLPNEWLAQAPEPLKHHWVHTWRDHIRPIFERVDALITTTDSAREVYLRSFPELRDQRFEIIEHGRDLPQATVPSPAPEPGGRIRILVPGNLDVHKGATFIRALQELDHEERLEFHLLGKVEPAFRELGTYHGTYVREEFHDRVAEIGPAFVGLFSICVETYSHTLTEAWSCGLPVIASNLGALGERVRRHGRGWLINVGDAESAYRRILSIADDPEEYWSVRREVTAEDLPAVADMAHQYDILYRSTLRNRRQFESEFEGPDRERNLPLDVGLIVVRGRDPGAYPGSVHVRTLRRYQHPSLEFGVVASVTDSESFISGRRPTPDVLYVQRNAVPTSLTEELVDTCKAKDVPLVVDLDDNLLDPDQLPADDDQWREAAPGIQQLVAKADLVTVSTPPLRGVVERWSPHVEVVPNQLDARLWLRPLERQEVRSRNLRILYMGTRTHEEDLAMLRPVMTRFDVDPDITIELEVVGAEPRGHAQDWYTRLPIPPGTSHYPRFVRWLRSQAPRWDIAVAPLAETEFNLYKSDLKFLEYSALGLPGVFSDVPAYANTVRDGRTGVLVKNTVENWYARLKRLAMDRELRRQLRERSWSYVAEHRTVEQHAAELQYLLSSVVARKGTKHAAA